MLFGLPLMSSLAWWFMLVVGVTAVVWTSLVRKKLNKEEAIESGDR